MRSSNRTAIVTGAGGFIGHHLVNDLKEQGYWVRGIDATEPKWESKTDEYIVADLRTQFNSLRSMGGADVAYLLACDVGGLGYMEGKDAELLVENTRIAIESIQAAARYNIGRIVFASSAVVYPDMIDGEAPYHEDDACPYEPMEGGYGYAKLFGEKICEYYADRGVNIVPARLGNTYGPEGSWCDGREKAPAAICTKVALAKHLKVPYIEIWGDGEQKRTFNYIDDAVWGLQAIAHSEAVGKPVNLASTEEVTIREMAAMVMDIADYQCEIHSIDGPVGARRRAISMDRYRDLCGMEHRTPLRAGLKKTYQWIEEQVRK